METAQYLPCGASRMCRNTQLLQNARKSMTFSLERHDLKHSGVTVEMKLAADLQGEKRAGLPKAR
jgi:hypothetical protein